MDWGGFMGYKSGFSMVGIALLFMSITLWGCARYPARQTPDERVLLKAPLAPGEHIVLANSCSKVDRADFLGGGTAVFGSCFLTNLRLIYEESKWAKNLAAIGKAVPTQGDFGIKHILKGAYELFNANYLIEVGNRGDLHLVVREGQVIIPLSDITSMELSGTRFSSASPSDISMSRWVTITTRDSSSFVFEIYNLPPDNTGWMPVYESGHWKKEIERVRASSFH